jgi:hypothetical protein
VHPYIICKFIQIYKQMCIVDDFTYNMLLLHSTSHFYVDIIAYANRPIAKNVIINCTSKLIHTF